MALITKVSGKSYRVCTDAENDAYDELSFKTDASDVSFTDGTDAETNLAAIKGITSDMSCEDESIAISAKAVNDSLGGFEFKLENGKKQVSTDGGSTWENFNSGSGIIAFGYGRANEYGTSAVASWSYDKNIFEVENNILTFKESGEYTIFLFGNGMQGMQGNNVTCRINNSTVYTLGVGGGGNGKEYPHQFNVGDTFEVQSSASTAGIASGYCIYEPYYPYGKPLIPIMTSNTTPSGEVTYSGSVITGNPYNVFDNADSTVFELKSSSDNWLQYKFVNPVKVAYFGIDAVDRRSSTNISLGVRVKNITLQASNNGTTWTDLISATTVNDTSISMQMFGVNANESYLYYRFKVSGSHNTSNTGNVINQLQLY